MTSFLELKLDHNTLFEWHKHSQESTDIPDYKELINLRAHAGGVIPFHYRPSGGRSQRSFGRVLDE